MSKGEDDELARAWHELMNRYHRVSCVLDRALQVEHGITGSEFAVLEQLAEARDCSLRLNELGEHAHVTQSALSRPVARLRAARLPRLRAAGSPEGAMGVETRRSVKAGLSPAGRYLYRRARPSHRAVLR